MAGAKFILLYSKASGGTLINFVVQNPLNLHSPIFLELKSVKQTIKTYVFIE
jgi:hypothetical protein